MRPGRVAPDDRDALHGAARDRAPGAEAEGPRLGRRGNGRGGRCERDRVPARRRGDGTGEGLVRGARDREGGRAGPEAVRVELRAGRRPPRLRCDRPPGDRRRGTRAAGAGRPGDRRGRRRRVARGADRQGARRHGHRRGQRLEGRSCPVARRRRRDRLHARGLHGRLAAVGRDHRHRGSASAVGAPPRPDPEGNARDRGRRRRRRVDRRLLPRDAARAHRVALRRTAVARVGDEDHAGRPRRLSPSSSRPARSCR